MEKKIKIEIKNRFTGKILFEYEKVDNTIKATLEKAVRNGADLRGAYLGDADLRGAYLRGAYLRGADLGDADLRGAYLRGAYLGDADLHGAYLGDADLRGAYLRGADLRDADLRGAYLRGADLRGAYLGGAYLGGAYLGGAYLGDADLHGAYLCGAYLGGADLHGAYLGGADLRGANDIPFIPMACPSDGAFIGWKKVVSNGIVYLVKLLIPEDAKRSSATGRKCRCSKAQVLEISVLKDGKECQKEAEVVNYDYRPNVTYEVGHIVEPDSFDDDRWHECSNGIHFFINKQEAIDY